MVRGVEGSEWHLITGSDTGRETCKGACRCLFHVPSPGDKGNSCGGLGGLKAGGAGRGPGRSTVREQSLLAHFWFGQVQVRSGVGRAEATNVHFSWHLQQEDNPDPLAQRVCVSG